MGAVTFGEVLDRARGHLDACAAIPDSALRGETIAGAAQVVSRVAVAVSRYLDDIAPYGLAEAIASDGPHTRVQAAVDARETLLLAAAHLRQEFPDSRDAGRGAAETVMAPLIAAGTALVAGRDLLRTHFRRTSDDEMVAASDWSAVITSRPVTAAVLEEAGRWAQQLGVLTARLAAAAAVDRSVPVAVSQRLAEACRELLAAGVILAAGPAGAAAGADAELLHAIPIAFPPGRQPPDDTETAAELAAGIAVSAARLRVVTRAVVRTAVWSPAMSADSWRWTATGAAVVCNVSEIMLGRLAGEPDPAARGVAAATPDLVRAAEAAAGACDRWREVTAAWNGMTTDTRGLFSPVVADAGDLVVRMGRLAFADPGWTPARSRRAPLRGIADLAPDAGRAVAVVGAVHHAADALAGLALADLRAVGEAIRGNRVHVPTRTLYESDRVRYRYWTVPPARAEALREVYRGAVQASERLVAELDAVAVTMNAPSRILAAARVASRAEAEIRGAGRGASERRAEAARAWDAELELAVPARPGPVERAVRRAGGADVVVVMRARAIDTAARKLVADARIGAQDGDQAGPASDASEPTPLSSRSEAWIASVCFPQGAGARHGTGMAAPEAAPDQMLSTVNAPLRPPARSTPKPAPLRRTPRPASGSAASPHAPRPPPRPSAQKWYCSSSLAATAVKEQVVSQNG
jgi:hypothetical protein